MNVHVYRCSNSVTLVVMLANYYYKIIKLSSLDVIFNDVTMELLNSTFSVFSALRSVTSYNTLLSHTIGCPTALNWRTTPWSALCAWSRWRLMTSTSSPARAAIRSAASVGIASAQMRTASALPAERWGDETPHKWIGIFLQKEQGCWVSQC